MNDSKMETEMFKNVTIQHLKRPIIFEKMPGVLHTIFVPALSIMDDLAKLELDWDFFFITFMGDFISIIYPEDRQVTLGERLLNEELKNPGAYQKLIDGWKVIDQEYHLMCKNLDRVNLEELSLAETKDAYVKFFSLFKKVWALPLTVTAISYYSDNVWIPKIVKKYGQTGISDFTLLSTSLEPSCLKQEEYSLLKIAVELANKKVKDINEVKKRFPHLSKRLEKHSERYFWISNTYRDGNRLDAAYFLNHIKKIRNPVKKLQQFQKDHIEFEKRWNILLKNNIFNEEERTIASLIRKGTVFQDLRKKNNLIGNYYLMQFLRAISHKSDYSYTELCYTTPYELIDILSGKKLDKGMLEKRSQCCILYLTPKEQILLGGKDAFGMYSLFDNINVTDNEVTEVKGVTASLGMAKGIARIVLDAHNFKEFNDGDVLIASMTRPEYTSLMKKASAIVTDEGGITCHAAIVARELGIPCVIGTKIATKVIKDGDLIEVKANHGKVIVLEKK